MPLNLATAQTCVNLCIGVTALFSANGWGLTEIRRALGCLQDADSLARTVAALGLDTTAKQLTAAARRAAADLEASAELAPHAHDCRVHFEQVIHLCDFEPGTMVAARTDAARIVDNWRTHIAGAAPGGLKPYFADPETPSARFFAGVTLPVIDALLRDPAFQPVLDFDRWRTAFDLLDAIKADTTELLSRIAYLTQKIESMEDGAAARAAGVSERALFRLIEPIAQNITDRDEALLALQEAVQIARRVQEEGRHGSNLGDFVDAVLGRVTALSAQGEFRSAISELDDALQREEAESNARRLRLLNAAIDQHLLAFDADGAAARIVQRVEMETPDPAARFDALRAEWRTWWERGRDKGLNLDLRVAIALAEASHRIAADDWQRGAALNDLGGALQTLGEREQDTARLEQAVAAYEAATTIYTRDALPLDWAMTRNNLGNALRALGEREQGTARLEQAVAAYEAALTIHTREALPLDWAGTQNNLGGALDALGAREQGTARLERAVAAYEAALTIHTREALPLDWAGTQNNLGIALATLGAREQGTARLQQAVAACEAALTVRTRDALPFLWAQTRENMADAYEALFQKTGDRAQLALAKEAVAEALEVYTAARAGHFIAGATRLRDLLATL